MIININHIIKLYFIIIMCLFRVNMLWKKNIFAKNILSPLHINDFKERKIVTNDTWNKIDNGSIKLKYYDEFNIEIGYITYKLHVGQIGIFVFDKKYRNRGLGKQILLKVIKDMKSNQVKEVWTVTRDDHPFWSNVFNNSFIKRDSVHMSVSGSGYFMKI